MIPAVYATPPKWPGLIPEFEFRKLFCYILEPDGAVAQLGERLTGSQKVVGSNPISSTTKKEVTSSSRLIPSDSPHKKRRVQLLSSEHR
jgi:hypothetical protein